MRILAAIPHYFDPNGSTSHGSTRPDAPSRVRALSACVAALRQHFGGPQVIIDIASRETKAVNGRVAATSLDVVVCTTRGRHLLAEVDLPAGSFLHQSTDADPRLLGFECHAALYERLGDYDHYAYLEDDLVIHDPWFFAKLDWFRSHVGLGAALQPNRYEVARSGPAWKVYVDGDLRPEVTAPFQNPGEFPELKGNCLGREVAFRRTRNPHAGCFFLSAEQMRTWALRDDFLDRDCRFVGPLESAASLGLMRTFRVYKPAPDVASFLEIEHAGTAFIGNIRRRGDDSDR